MSSTAHNVYLLIIFIGISLRKVDPQQQNAQRASYNQGDLMREIRDGIKFAINIYYAFISNINLLPSFRNKTSES